MQGLMTILNKVVREDLTKVIAEQRLEGNEGTNHVDF